MDDRYRWYSYIEIFITNLNMVENEVYEMNYIHSLNWLAYLKHKRDIEDKKRNNKL